jgi:hypothetical protein
MQINKLFDNASIITDPLNGIIAPVVNYVALTDFNFEHHFFTQKNIKI